jgi:hypothetical protein
VEGTVKCTGQGGRVLSHQYSNEMRTPLGVASAPCNEVRSNAVHNPSKAQICTNITTTLVTTELARLESRSTSRSCNCAFSCTSEKSPLWCVFSFIPLYQLTICLLFTALNLAILLRREGSSRPTHHHSGHSMILWIFGISSTFFPLTGLGGVMFHISG